MKTNIFVNAVFLAFLVAGLVVSVAFADPPTPYPGNSEPGGDRYTEVASNPNPDAQCGSGAASGAFGYLGKDLNPGEETWNGGNGTKPGTTAQTGINNSAVCGNRP
jgi:hypothetical protein